MIRARLPTRSSTRSLISAAALLVNVIARIEPGWALRSEISQAIRRVSTRVLPEPAPATTSSGAPACTTAARCGSLSPSSKDSVDGVRRGVTASRPGIGNVLIAGSTLRVRTDLPQTEDHWCGRRGQQRRPVRGKHQPRGDTGSDPVGLREQGAAEPAAQAGHLGPDGDHPVASENRSSASSAALRPAAPARTSGQQDLGVPRGELSGSSARLTGDPHLGAAGQVELHRHGAGRPARRGAAASRRAAPRPSRHRGWAARSGRPSMPLGSATRSGAWMPVASGEVPGVVHDQRLPGQPRDHRGGRGCAAGRARPGAGRRASSALSRAASSTRAELGRVQPGTGR